jgi:dinuclear metal center YbgI/SA1388 family protein
MAKKSSQPTIQKLIEVIEMRIPTSCAEEWDAVGLVCGDPSKKLTGVVIGVDLTEALYETALKKKANLIVIHHPPLFPKGRGLTRLVKGRDSDLNTILLKAFEKKIAIYVAHTNFDRCALDGMIALADDLGAEAVARVWEQPEEGKTLLKKLVTYVPVESFESVRDALFGVGCGHIGFYDSCGFAMGGIGSFRGLKGANPTIGKVGELELVEEIRLETLFIAGMEKVVIETLRDAHPYEEVAFDIYAVEQDPGMKGLVWGLGYGFVANLKKPVSFAELVKRVKKVFKVDAFLTHQFEPKQVRKIAFTPGKGSSFVRSVSKHQVDVYITGEVGYHGSLDAARNGVNVMELGHRESEHYFLKTIAYWCSEWDLPHFVLDERTQRIV